MAKKVKAVVRLNIEAGKANPGRTIGPALAPHGINLMAFCKEYNARTASMVGQIIPVDLTIFADSSFTFNLRTPPTSDMLRRAAGIAKGSGEPNKNKVAKISRKQLREIAETKLKDLNATNIDGAMAQIAGTARSMGIEISD
jgi:large subunit ribosomal protein L11